MSRPATHRNALRAYEAAARHESPTYPRERTGGDETLAVRDQPLIHDDGRAIWREWCERYEPGCDGVRACLEASVPVSRRAGA